MPARVPCLKSGAAITTVGYGEITPRSFLGRVITLPLLVFGLLLIALPTFVLGREFSIVWEFMEEAQVRPAPFPPSRTCVRLNLAFESSRRKLVSRTKISTRSTIPSHLHCSVAGDLRKLPRQRVYGDTPPKKSRGRARAGLRALVAASVMDMETLQVPPTVRRPRYQRSSRSYAPKWRRKKRCSSALWQLLNDQG